jgi:hypothetical protein
MNITTYHYQHIIMLCKQWDFTLQIICNHDRFATLIWPNFGSINTPSVTKQLINNYVVLNNP